MRQNKRMFRATLLQGFGRNFAEYQHEYCHYDGGQRDAEFVEIEREHKRCKRRRNYVNNIVADEQGGKNIVVVLAEFEDEFCRSFFFVRVVSFARNYSW